MLLLIILVVASAAISMGYFLNIYTVFILAFTLFAYLFYDARRTVSDKNEETRGGILIYCILTPFMVIMLITSVIVNHTLVASFSHSIARGITVLLFR